VTDRSPVAVAWSTDGATLDYRSPLELGLRLGDYVAVHVDGRAEPWLAQLSSQRSVERDGRVWIEGSGRLLGTGPGESPFDRSAMTAAVPELVRQLLRRGGPEIELGRLQRVPELPAVIDVRGFNRHTFLCGQSGSGKTYALGGLLEQLILATRLPLLILDPNGDHVNLGRTREGVEADVAARYGTAAADVRTLYADPPDGADPLRIRFKDLGVAGVAALLQLDPIADRREYNGVVHALRATSDEGFPSIEAALAAFRASDDEVLDRIRMRAENLGIDRMAAWAGPTGPSTRTIADVWQDRPRALIADTSGFEERRERITVAVAVLEQLWAARHDRQPLLLVVDEAHDVCPADPADPLQRLAVELFTRIAGEGRKYGIHLLLASQRPDKLPDNVLSQCDNLLLMRVNSAGDRASLASRFAFVPPELVDLSATFGLGDMLRAGRISPDPQLARTGPRLTPEGGADVPTDWADPSGS
jgi:uncharacterized protein